MRAGFVRLLLVKLRQCSQQLGLQGLPVVRVQQQGVALGQGMRCRPSGTGGYAGRALQVRQGQAKAGLGQQGAGVASGQPVLQGLPGGLALGAAAFAGGASGSSTAAPPRVRLAWALRTMTRSPGRAKTGASSTSWA